ncbi:MAG: hypothetical protein Q9187_003989 [Circinaria calcarea]
MDVLVWHDKVVPGSRVVVSDQAKGLIASLAKRKTARRLAEVNATKAGLGKEQVAAVGDAAAAQLDDLEAVIAVTELEEKEGVHPRNKPEGEEAEEAEDDEDIEDIEDIDAGCSLYQIYLQTGGTDRNQKPYMALDSIPYPERASTELRILLDGLRPTEQRYLLANYTLKERQFVTAYLKTYPNLGCFSTQRNESMHASLDVAGNLHDGQELVDACIKLAKTCDVLEKRLLTIENKSRIGASRELDREAFAAMHLWVIQPPTDEGWVMSWRPEAPDIARETRQREEAFDEGRGDIFRDQGRNLVTRQALKIIEEQEELTGPERERFAADISRTTDRVVSYYQKDQLVQSRMKRALTGREMTDKREQDRLAQLTAKEQKEVQEVRVAALEEEQRAKEQEAADINARRVEEDEDSGGEAIQKGKLAAVAANAGGEKRQVAAAAKDVRKKERASGKHQREEIKRSRHEAKEEKTRRKRRAEKHARESQLDVDALMEEIFDSDDEFLLWKTY